MHCKCYREGSSSLKRDRSPPNASCPHKWLVLGHVAAGGAARAGGTGQAPQRTTEEAPARRRLLQRQQSSPANLSAPAEVQPSTGSFTGVSFVKGLEGSHGARMLARWPFC